MDRGALQLCDIIMTDTDVTLLKHKAQEEAGEAGTTLRRSLSSLYETPKRGDENSALICSENTPTETHRTAVNVPEYSKTCSNIVSPVNVLGENSPPKDWTQCRGLLHQIRTSLEHPRTLVFV